MGISFVEGAVIRDKTLEKVEKELGRKLTESELEIFYKVARIAMMKGYNYATYGIL